MAMKLSVNKRENCQSSKDGFDKSVTLYEGRHVCHKPVIVKWREKSYRLCRSQTDL